MWVLLGVVGIYSGVGVAEVYLPYWQLADFAPSITDDVIRRRLLNKVDELELPAAAASELRIRRRSRHYVRK
jgi:hypothetical protein